MGIPRPFDKEGRPCFSYPMVLIQNQSRRAPGPVCIYVAGRLREIRSTRGLSCASVAQRVGMTTTAYVKLESGRSRMNLDDLFSILAVLEAKPEDAWPPEAWHCASRPPVKS